MQKKLVLISPLGDRGLLGSDFYFRMPYLGLLKVAALTPPDWDVTIIDEKVESLDLQLKADLVGITTTTPLALRAYQIGDHFRSRGIPVVIGGMHASKLPDVVKRMHDHGIGVNGSFIFGFDSDDDGVFERTAEFVEKAKIDVVYYSILTPYPGTALHEQLSREGRIIDHDWNHYNTHNVVYQPKNMTPERLLEGYWWALNKSFSYSSILKRMWSNGTRYNFFFPMNFGFRQSVKKAQKQMQKT